MDKCMSCGADIIWIKTKSGKKMPCDFFGRQYFKRSDNGNRTVVTLQGEVVIKCIFVDTYDVADGAGYVPHFVTCPNAAVHRKKPEKAERAAQQAEQISL